jgi:hypothetical protein
MRSPPRSPPCRPARSRSRGMKPTAAIKESTERTGVPSVRGDAARRLTPARSTAESVLWMITTPPATANDPPAPLRYRPTTTTQLSPRVDRRTGACQEHERLLSFAPPAARHATPKTVSARAAARQRVARKTRRPYPRNTAAHSPKPRPAQRATRNRRPFPEGDPQEARSSQSSLRAWWR